MKKVMGIGGLIYYLASKKYGTHYIKSMIDIEKEIKREKRKLSINGAYIDGLEKAIEILQKNMKLI